MIRMAQNMFRAFRVCCHWGVRMFGFQPDQFLFGKPFMNNAASRPQHNVAAGLAGQVGTQMPVRRQDDGLILRNLVNDVFCIGRGDDNVR